MRTLLLLACAASVGHAQPAVPPDRQTAATVDADHDAALPEPDGDDDLLAWGGGPHGPGAAWRMGAGGHGPMHGPRMGAGRKAARMHHLLGELGLNRAQRERVHDLMAGQARRRVQQQADVKLARMDLHLLMRSERPDRAAIEAQIDKVARLQAEGQKSRVSTHLELLSVLTPEQRERMHELRSRAPGGQSPRSRRGTEPRRIGGPHRGGGTF